MPRRKTGKYRYRTGRPPLVADVCGEKEKEANPVVTTTPETTLQQGKDKKEKKPVRRSTRLQENLKRQEKTDSTATKQKPTERKPRRKGNRETKGTSNNENKESDTDGLEADLSNKDMDNDKSGKGVRTRRSPRIKKQEAAKKRREPSKEKKKEVKGKANKKKASQERKKEDSASESSDNKEGTTGDEEYGRDSTGNNTDSSTDTEAVAEVLTGKPVSTQTPREKSGEWYMMMSTDGIRKESIQERHKRKEAEEVVYFESVLLDEVVIDDDNPVSVGKTCVDTTPIQSIKGKSPDKIGIKALQVISRKFKIKCTRNKSKKDLLKLIKRKKKEEDLQQEMYSDNFSVAGGSEERPKRPAKGSRPTEIILEGSLYRVLLTYFLQEHQDNVMKLGTNPVAHELRSELNHVNTTFNLLAETYNDKNRTDIAKLPFQHEIFVARGVKPDEPSDFDTIDRKLFQHTLLYLNAQYKKAFDNSKKLGHHRPFDAYCQSAPWTLLYHHLLEEAGDDSLRNFAQVELPDHLKKTSNGGSSSLAKAKKRRTSVCSPTRDKDGHVEVMKQFVSLQEKKSSSEMEHHDMLAFQTALKTYSFCCNSLRDLRKNSDYDSDGVEAMEWKDSIEAATASMRAAKRKIRKTDKDQQPTNVLCSQDSDDDASTLSNQTGNKKNPNDNDSSAMETK